MFLLGEGSEATEPYNKHDKIRPHSIRSCNSIKRFDLCPFDQKNSTHLQPPFADDLKILAVAKTQEQKKSDLEAFSNWVDTNGKSLVPDKSYKREFRGTNSQYRVGNISFEVAEEVKDQGILVKKRSQLVSIC